MVADAVEKSENVRGKSTSARYEKSDAVAKEIFSDLLERRSCNRVAKRAERVGKRKRESELFIRRVSLILYLLERRLVYSLPYHRNCKDVRNLVLLDGILHGSGIEVLGENEGAREEAEPEVYGDKAEYVVEGKKSELLELALIMLLYLRALLYDIAAVAYLPEEVFARVGAELDLIGSARGHKEDLSTKSLSHMCGVALCYLVGNHGLYREGLSVRDHRADLVERDYILKRLVGQTGVHKQRTVAADEYLPEYLDPLDRIRHIYSDKTVVRKLTDKRVKRGSGAQDTLLYLTVGLLLYTVAVGEFSHNVILFGEHKLKKSFKAFFAGRVFCQLRLDVIVDIIEICNVVQFHLLSLAKNSYTYFIIA